MPPIRSFTPERCAYVVTVILSLGEIMPTYSRYILKGLVYITIAAPSGRQPSSCVKYTKLNIHSLCNIKIVFNAKYTFPIRLASL